MTAIPIASFIAAPLSGFLLELHGLGLKSWQWMFILEGIPSVLLGIVVLRFLTDRPSQATLADARSSGSGSRARWKPSAPPPPRPRARHDHGLGEVLRSLLSWNVLRLALIYFGLTTGLYGIELWLPQIVKSFGLSNIEVGLRRGHPLRRRHRHDDAVGQLLRPLRSSRLNHVALATGMGCVGHGRRRGRERAPGVDHGLPLDRYRRRHGRPAALLDLPTEFLSGRKAAAGIAAINSIGNLGGFFGPTLIGYAREITGSFTLGLMVSASRCSPRPCSRSRCAAGHPRTPRPSRSSEGQPSVEDRQVPPTLFINQEETHAYLQDCRHGRRRHRARGRRGRRPGPEGLRRARWRASSSTSRTSTGAPTTTRSMAS